MACSTAATTIAPIMPNQVLWNKINAREMSLRDALYDPGRMPIVGGRLCLDLANTANNGPHGVENCRLTNYEAVLAWGHHVGLLDEVSRRTLNKRASRRPTEAVEALARILRLREAIWTVFPLQDAITELPASIEENLDLERAYALRPVSCGLVLDPGDDLTARLTQPAASSVIELLSAGPTERVKNKG